jgi:hypothetical protein
MVVVVVFGVLVVFLRDFTRLKRFNRGRRES